MWIMVRQNKKRALLVGWRSLSDLKDFRLSLFGCFYYRSEWPAFQDSAKRARVEKYTVNNNVLFVPNFGTYWSFYA